MLLDASASMGYGSHAVNKLDYARFLAASLCYLAHAQRDAAGLIVFDEEVRNYVPPSTRQGQLFRLLHAIEKAEPGTRTDFAKPFVHFQEFLRRRGMVVVISDFYERPEVIVKTVEPLRFRGNEVVLFHVLDPQEIAPKFREPVLLVDMETSGTLEVSPEYARSEYRRKIDAHIAGAARPGQRRGHGLFPDGHRPAARRRLARISGGAPGEDVNGIPGALVFGGTRWRWACPSGCTCCKKHKTTPLPFSSLMFFERRTQSSIKHRRLQYLLLLALRAAVLVLLALAFASPFVQSHLAALAGGRKLTVLAVDNSFSMRQGDRLARAKQEAAQVAARLRRGRQAAGAGVRLAGAGDGRFRRRPSRPIEPTDARSSYAELVARAALHRAIGAHAGGGAPVLRHAEVVAARELRGSAAGRRRTADRASGRGPARRQLRRRERERAAPGLRRREGAGAGHHRRIRHGTGHAPRVPRD